MESGQRRKKERRDEMGGEETRMGGEDCMEREGTEEPTKRMENKARRQGENNPSMGGKGSEPWIPIFGAAKAMDYTTIANLAVTNREIRKVCEDEILARNLNILEIHPFSKQGWKRPIKRLDIRMPQANMDRFAAEYGMTTCVVLISVLDRQT